jgi:hypothetical protein
MIASLDPSFDAVSAIKFGAGGTDMSNFCF